MIKLLILLEANVPLASWLGIAVTIMLGLVGFLSRDAYNRINKRLDQIEDDQEVERKRSELEMRIMDGKISDLHINILKKLDEIKDKFNDFRK